MSTRCSFFLFCPACCLSVMFSGSCLALWLPCWERGSRLLCFLFACIMSVVSRSLFTLYQVVIH